MRKLVPFKLDPKFEANLNPTVLCSDCGKEIEFRHARVLMVDISEKKKTKTAKNISLDELARNTVWTILCEECWRKQYPGEPDRERVQ